MKRRRGTQRRPRMLASLALTLVIVGVPAALYLWGSHSSVFAIGEIRLEGAHQVSRDQALNLLKARFVGQNLFRVTTAQVTETLEPLAYLASVRINRDFPHTLVVNAVEYRPGAYVLGDKRWYMVATDGMVFKDAGKAKSGKPFAALAAGPPGGRRGLPCVLSGNPLVIDQVVDDPAVTEALALLQRLPTRLREAVKTVRATASGLEVRTSGDVIALFGDANRLKAKGVALETVLAYYRARGSAATYVDVSVPDRPVARPLL